jgi:hypothetical protein
MTNYPRLQANCYAIETTSHTVTVTEASYTSTMTEAPEGMVTVYVDPADSQTYTYGASTIFEVYVYTTTQNIDIVSPGQSCVGATFPALASPTPFAAWNPFASLGEMLGLNSPVTATPYDPYAPENLPPPGAFPAPGALLPPGGFDSVSYAEPPPPLGPNSMPIYPAYPGDAVPFDSGFHAGPGAAAGLPFKRVRRSPAAVEARSTPVM